MFMKEENIRQYILDITRNNLNNYSSNDVLFFWNKEIERKPLSMNDDHYLNNFVLISPARSANEYPKKRKYVYVASNINLYETDNNVVFKPKNKKFFNKFTRSVLSKKFRSYKVNNSKLPNVDDSISKIKNEKIQNNNFDQSSNEFLNDFKVLDNTKKKLEPVHELLSQIINNCPAKLNKLTDQTEYILNHLIKNSNNNIHSKKSMSKEKMHHKPRWINISNYADPNYMIKESTNTNQSDLKMIKKDINMNNIMTKFIANSGRRSFEKNDLNLCDTKFKNFLNKKTSVFDLQNNQFLKNEKIDNNSLFQTGIDRKIWGHDKNHLTDQRFPSFSCSYEYPKYSIDQFFQKKTPKNFSNESNNYRKFFPDGDSDSSSRVFSDVALKYPVNRLEKEKNDEVELNHLVWNPSTFHKDSRISSIIFKQLTS